MPLTHRHIIFEPQFDRDRSNPLKIVRPDRYRRGLPSFRSRARMVECLLFQSGDSRINTDLDYQVLGDTHRRRWTGLLIRTVAFESLIPHQFVGVSFNWEDA